MKNISKKISITFLIALTTMSLAGCSTSSTLATINVEVENIISNNNEANNEIKTFEYDFGKEVYTSTSKKEMPYEIKGTVSIPKVSSDNPLVLIVHGSHSNDKLKRFDTGFKYLTEELAKNGYTAVSLDLSAAYYWKYGDNDDREKVVAMVQKHIEKLKEANEVDGDFKNKIDFNNIALIGHSRGGSSIFEAAKSINENAGEVKGILSVAPAFDANINSYPEINTSIIVPEYDGDVVTLDGYKIFDILSESNQKETTSLTLLEKANHNNFNSELKINDADLRGEEFSKNIIKREYQEEFLANYAVDYLDSIFKKSSNNREFFEGKGWTVDKMYGLDVKTLNTNNSTQSILDVAQDKNLNAENVEVNSIKDSWFYKLDEAIGFDSITLGENATRNLLNVKWENLNSSVTFKPTVSDFSNKSTLLLRVGVNPMDKENTPGEFQKLTIQVKDNKGNVADIAIDKDMNSLDYVEGKVDETPINGIAYKYWTRPTPLSDIRIPLDKLSNLNLKNIQEVSLIFDKVESGSIMVEGIYIQ
ncbi:MAG: hypothetical protein ACRC92_23215 [Peptostreptococcaceae bacterium]